VDGTPELEVQVELHPRMVVPDGAHAEDVELPFPDEVDDAAPAAEEVDQIVEESGVVDPNAYDSIVGRAALVRLRQIG
jgi:hypothetical protein